jgi:hypothetical protein
MWAKYFDHMGVTVKHTLFGVSYPMGLWVLILLIGFVWWRFSALESQRKKTGLMVLLGILFSHSLLFMFHAPLKVFLNVTVHVPLLILASFGIVELWRLRQFLLALATTLVIVIFAWMQLISYTAQQRPFELYNCIQTGMLFSQKLELIDMMYELSEGERFSMSVLGTPYGVRTVWASVFEQYQRRTGQEPPVWVGYHANGYPADNFFEVSDHPKEKHIVVIESGQDLIPKFHRDQFMDNVNETTRLIREETLYGYVLQLREPLPATESVQLAR